jgi:tellurite resistance protein
MTIRALRPDHPGRVAAARPPLRLTANLFGLPFGLCGTAQAWSAGRDLAGVPAWPAAVLWVLAAAAWLVTLVAYGVDVVTDGRWRTEPADPVFGPFTVLAAIVPMLLGVELSRYARPAGEVVFVTALVATVLAGGWITGGWIVAPQPLDRWHPAYQLPTVAGGLLGAGGSAALGHRDLAMVLFGLGGICWITLGSIVLVRLVGRPPLPPPLRPTLAIEVAPPVVAGSAWFAINGNRPDAVALALAGYATLMVLVQLRLVPIHRTAPFGVGTWAFSFSYAAAAGVALRWLDVGQEPGRRALSWVLLSALTAGIAVLAGRTALGLRRGTYLPRATRPAEATAGPE